MPGSGRLSSRRVFLAGAGGATPVLLGACGVAKQAAHAAVPLQVPPDGPAPTVIATAVAAGPPATPTAQPTAVPTSVPDGVAISSQQLRQGNTALIRMWSAGAKDVNATFDGHPIGMMQEHEGGPWIGFAAVQRSAALGPRPLRFTITAPNGEQTVRTDPADTIEIVDAHYPIYHLTMPPSSLALIVDPAKVNEEEAFLNSVYRTWTDERHWHGAFLAPVGTVTITSDFGDRRSINGGPANYWHEGTDFGVWVGTPIHAAADGVVAFAGPLYVRGNVTVIDHGWGIMTGYFHQSELHVAKGQPLQQGDVIGLSGDTGFVTGPHLHFEVRTRTIWVEPLEWLNWDPFPRPDLASV